jgi:hypothetical protein
MALYQHCWEAARWCTAASRIVPAQGWARQDALALSARGLQHLRGLAVVVGAESVLKAAQMTDHDRKLASNACRYDRRNPRKRDTFIRARA